MRLGCHFVVVVAAVDRAGRGASLPLTLTSHNKVSGMPLYFTRVSLLRYPGVELNEYKNEGGNK